MKKTMHISLPCRDIEKTKDFYVDKLGASTGRISNQWVDINFYNHQITFNASGTYNFWTKSYSFEGVVIPSFHFGVILERKDWNDVYERLSELDVIEIPAQRFLENKPGQHSSFFVKDPNDYMIEFKSFKSESEIFNR